MHVTPLYAELAAYTQWHMDVLFLCYQSFLTSEITKIPLF